MTGIAVKRKVLAHLEMTRPYTMFHSGLVTAAAAEIASGGQIAPWRVVLAALVTICGWEAGLYAGDYYDREIDAQSKPTRAIPSGRVSPREAFTTMICLIVAGYIFALILSPANLLLAVITTVLGIAYSKTFKSMAILGNFDRGVLGICAVFFGAQAGGALISLPIFLLAGLVFFHDSATNLVGAIRDIDGDRAADCTTVPVVYGLARAVDIVCVLALCWVIFGAFLMAGLRANVLAIVLFAAALLIAASVYFPLAALRKQVTRRDALNAHKLLVVERLTLMCAFLAVFVPTSAALAVLVVTLGATAISQALLRDRYEKQQILHPAIRG